MARWRIVLHALDRTGPPVLALSFIRWLHREHPGDDIEVVALRGGSLVDDAVRYADVVVLLEQGEPWDLAERSSARFATVRQRLDQRPRPAATLLVSVAAGLVLPVMSDPGPVVTWVVEQGDDLRWIDEPTELRQRTSVWLAGSESSRTEATERLDRPVDLVREFVDDEDPVDRTIARRCRTAIGVDPDDLLVVGAGIATRRKAPDLFVQTAASLQRRHGTAAHFLWIGGERDPLYWPMREDARRAGLKGFSTMENVANLHHWLSAADVFLHTARLDAFPLVCLHSAVAGTPVVAFRGAGGTTEMFADSFVGASYPDLGGLADLVHSLATPSVHERVAREQSERVRSTYVTEVCAPQLYGRLEAAAQVDDV